MRDDQKTLDFCARLAICLCGCTLGQAVTGAVAAESVPLSRLRELRQGGAAQRRGDCADMGRSVLRPYTSLGEPLGGDGGFGAAVAAAAARVGVGPGAPVFLLEELDEDLFCVGARGIAQRSDDGILLGVVEDAVDEDGEIGAQEREVDAEFAEGGGFAGLRYRGWNLVAGDDGGFERFALVGVFAGAGDRVDEGVAVGDDQAADDPCRDFVSAQFVFPYSSNDNSNGRMVGRSGVTSSTADFRGAPTHDLALRIFDWSLSAGEILRPLVAASEI